MQLNPNKTLQWTAARGIVISCILVTQQGKHSPSFVPLTINVLTKR
jgi:hypothetical protein